jgi:hypothetical protein
VLAGIGLEPLDRANRVYPVLCGEPPNRQVRHAIPRPHRRRVWPPEVPTRGFLRPANP